MNMKSTLSLLTALLIIASPIASAKKEIDWSKYDLPDIGKDKMWCMFTEYEMVNEERQLMICSYICQNGMIVNMPGVGRCRRDIQEIRW